VKQDSGNRRNLTGVLLIGGLFFVFGFVTWINGALIPFLAIACELSHLQAYFVTLAFYIAYTVMALPMSLVLRRTGYKNGLALGLLMMAGGALIFIPAAMLRTYGIFLGGLFVMGTGLAILQTAANPYIVRIGPERTAAVRISIMGLLNKGAGILAPLAFTALVLADVSQFTEARLASLGPAERLLELGALSSRLIEPYLVLAGLLLLLALYIKLSPLPDPEFPAGGNERGQRSLLRRPNLVLGVVAIFFYMGAEVVAGDTISLFARELGVANFGQLTACTMAFMMLGYLLGVLLIPRWISQEKALMLSALLGVLLSILVLTGNLESDRIWSATLAWSAVPALPDAVVLVALFGLANALVWPAVWPMALKGLNRAQTETGSALLIMAIAGGAIVPLAFGALTDASTDPRTGYWVMLPCYLVILAYALFGRGFAYWSRNAVSAGTDG